MPTTVPPPTQVRSYVYRAWTNDPHGPGGMWVAELARIPLKQQISGQPIDPAVDAWNNAIFAVLNIIQPAVNQLLTGCVQASQASSAAGPAFPIQISSGIKVEP